MSPSEQKTLSAQADQILAQAGYTPDGRTLQEKKETGRSVKMIWTPFGGQPRRLKN